MGIEKNRISSLYTVSFLILLALLPWSLTACTYAIIIFAITGLMTTSWKEKKQLLKAYPYSLLFPIFYILFIIGACYAENLKDALFNLEKKLAFLAIPIIVATSAPFTIEIRNKSLMAFIFSNLLLTVFYFLINLFSLINGEPYQGINFDSHNLGRFYEANELVNPVWLRFSYIAFGHLTLKPTLFSIFLIYCNAVLYLDESIKIKLLFRWGMIFWFSLIILLLSSRTGVVIFIALALFMIIKKSKFNFKGVWQATLFLILIMSGIAISPVTRFRIIEEPIATKLRVPADPTQWNSISLRWLEWKSGIAEIKNSLWFGTGTGGTKAALRKHYDKVELGDFAQDYDSHNQYIETFLEIGIFGFLTLCAGFIIPLRFSLMHSEPTLLALVFIISMASITATVFEKSQGIIFYCSFVSLAMYSQYGSEGSR